MTAACTVFSNGGFRELKQKIPRPNSIGVANRDLGPSKPVERMVSM